MQKQLRRYWWVTIIVFIGVPIAWYLGSPLFINRVVNEPFPTSSGSSDFPMSKGATVPPSMTQKQVEEQMMEASKIDANMADPMPASAAQGKVIARGTFAGADDFHKGEGAVTVYRGADRLVLRLDPFRVTNGPDLRVVLTKHAAPKKGADVLAGYIEVGKLKGNIGSQNYRFPLSVNLVEYRAVVIYCQPFNVVFATAPLRPAE